MKALVNRIRYAWCRWQFSRLDPKDKRVMAFLGCTPTQLKAEGRFG